MPRAKTQKKVPVRKEEERLLKEIDSLRIEVKEMKEIVNMILNMVIDTDEEEEYPGVQLPDFDDRYGPNN